MALIRADIEAVQRGAVEGDEICEIAGLGPIPAMVARELLGDAILKLVLTKGVDVANLRLLCWYHHRREHIADARRRE